MKERCKGLWKESSKCLKMLEGTWVGPALLGEIRARRWHSCQCLRCCLLSVRTSSLVNKTFCVGRTHDQFVFTHLGIYKWIAFKRQVIEVMVHCCCSILGVRFWLHGLVRLVLKHGPSSLTWVQVFGCFTCKRDESECLDLCTCKPTVILRVVWVRACKC